MNKRLKLKKGILHKKCDESCMEYKCIKAFGFFTNIGCCDNCKFKNGKAIKDLLEANRPSNVIIID